MCLRLVRVHFWPETIYFFSVQVQIIDCIFLLEIADVNVEVNIACALMWGVASVGITLLGMTHSIREKHFKYETCAGGRFSSVAARAKNTDVCLL